MSKINIKICGLTQKQDMQVCYDLGVKWTGFVFYPNSPRAVTLEQANDLHHAVPSSYNGGPLRVGLFVKPTVSMLFSILDVLDLDILQLYGDINQTILLCQLVKQECWFAHGIKSSDDLPNKAHNFSAYIIEAPHDKHHTRPGGLGKKFDWHVTKNWSSPLPWLLAGGLNPNNVQQAIEISGTHAVDVSSGVEEHLGEKSPFLIEKFVKNAKKSLVF